MYESSATWVSLRVQHQHRRQAEPTLKCGMRTEKDSGQTSLTARETSPFCTSADRMAEMTAMPGSSAKSAEGEVEDLG